MVSDTKPQKYQLTFSLQISIHDKVHDSQNASSSAYFVICAFGFLSVFYSVCKLRESISHSFFSESTAVLAIALEDSRRSTQFACLILFPTNSVCHTTLLNEKNVSVIPNKQHKIAFGCMKITGKLKWEPSI